MKATLVAFGLLEIDGRRFDRDADDERGPPRHLLRTAGPGRTVRYWRDDAMMGASIAR